MADMRSEINCILKAVTEYPGKGEKKACMYHGRVLTLSNEGNLVTLLECLLYTV